MRKEQSSKRVNQTFSLPLDVSKELHTYVKNREMSSFVSVAIRKELELKKKELRKSYREANKDKGQVEALHDWDSTASDGMNEVEW